MAVVAKSGTPSLCSLNPPQNDFQSGLLAGETITPGDVCYIKSDGKVWLLNGTAANAAALYDGVYLGDANVVAGEPITLHHNNRARYGSGLTPGARYFASATPGALEDAATTGGTVAIAKAVTATIIQFFAVNR